MRSLPANPYLLLTPGPLTTTPTVKAAMLQDWCTWDRDYTEKVQDIRGQLVALATAAPGYTCVPMQGSGTFCVEAAITTALPPGGKLLVLANGAYGRRMAEIACRSGIAHICLDSGDTRPPDPSRVDRALAADPFITHLAMVHCETTTGMINPVQAIGNIVRDHGRSFILDAMSSFGGIPMDMDRLHVDYLISSANKCLQGVPGFGFVIAKKAVLEKTRGHSPSLSLDLYDQWETMEKGRGKWRFTSPTHGVHALARALGELKMEGGIQGRWERYKANQACLLKGMKALGFETLLPEKYQGPIITCFLSPSHPGYGFQEFHGQLKKRGFVIYPGKLTQRETFRIGHIGDVHPRDMERLLMAMEASMVWQKDPATHPRCGG